MLGAASAQKKTLTTTSRRNTAHILGLSSDVLHHSDRRRALQTSVYRRKFKRSVADGIKEWTEDGLVSAGAVGALIAFLDTSGGFDHRRFRAVSRLRALRDSEEFETLPEDLRQRVREIVAGTDR